MGPNLYNEHISASMNDQVKFCYRCGANLPEGAVFCPECGSSIDGSEPTRTEYTAQPVNSGSRNTLGAVPTLTLIYGILAIIGAVFTILMGMSIDTILNMARDLYEEGAISESDYNTIITLFQTFTKIVFTAVGIILAISGAFAIWASQEASKMQSWNKTIALYGIAALTPAFMAPFDLVTAIILTVVGLIMTYLVYTHKNDFAS